jgi:hypothetical protein
MRSSETDETQNFRFYFIRSSNDALSAKIAASVRMFFELLLKKMFVKEHFEKIGTYQSESDFLDETLLVLLAQPRAWRYVAKVRK